MKLYSSLFRSFLLFFAVILLLAAPHALAQPQSAAQAAASAPQSSASQIPVVPARITQAIDETQLVTLKGNVHPLARPEFDQGPVADATPMNRMMLLLQRSPEQQAALQTFMEQQLDRQSPNFHNWLTPQQFGAQYGPADADIQTVTDWLSSHGFHNIKVAQGRTTIEFSGNVGQVRSAFHTEIHRYMVNGQNRQANVSDPQIPTALSPVVAGIVTLHNFPRKSMKRDAGKFVRTKDGVVKQPLFTTPSGCGSTQAQPCYILGPADFAKVYNIPSAMTGAGVTIALVADSNINPQDVADFRTLFGLSANFSIANVILNGPDPGPQGPGTINGDEGEADLDSQVSGMVAPDATINLIVSEGTLTGLGIDLSALYIVDNNYAPIMSESFGACEAGIGQAGNAFYDAMWEEAAAQGISVMVSAGDNGSAGCDDDSTEIAATAGLAVSGIASTPFDVAVGGTDFDDVGTQISGGFWSATNGTGMQSAQGYIHEMTWNNSCAATATSTTLNSVCSSPNNIVAGSGGPSNYICATSTSTGTCAGPYPKPSWQTATGVPADGVRDIPDVSLFASDGPASDSFYLVCQADAIPPGPPTPPPSCMPNAQGEFSFIGAGGTSASSPAFAGIMALIVQQQGGARQGNPGPVLYKIAQSETFSNCNSSTMPLAGSGTCVFYDVTKGNNSVPCVGASVATCSSQTAGTTGVLVTASGSTTPAWTTGTGYDLATGLGSVNVTNLSNAWKTAVAGFKASTTATKINGGTGQVTISHGTSVTLSATVTSGATGDVSFIAPTSVNGGIGFATLSGGTASTTTTFLPGGSYNVKASYPGDGNFAPSVDPTGVPVVVSKENSSVLPEMVDALGNINPASVQYGSGPDLRMDILNHTGNSLNCQPLIQNGVTTGCAIDATGSVTITDNGSSLAGSPFAINSLGHVEDQTIQLVGGAHTLVATYAGDISYNASPAVNLNVSVTTATTATSLAANPSTGINTTTAVALTATIATQSNGTGPTGTVTFFDGGTQIGSPVAVTSTAATSTTPAGATASLTKTFTTTGTHNITATYSGDTNYAGSPAGAINLTVSGTGNFTVTGAAVTVTAGSNGMSAITVTPSGGFTGTVNVTCGTTLPGVTCTPNPLAVNVTSASPVANNLTVAVAAPSTTLSASAAPLDRDVYAAALPPTSGGRGWWFLSAGTGLMAILLFFLPGRQRLRGALALGLGLVCVMSFAMGCGGGSSGGGGTGPVATTTQLTISTAKLALSANASITVSATVTGGTPTGNVQFFVDGAALGSSVPISGGTTGNITVTAANAPSFLELIGTHTVSAHYLGDTNTQPSQSNPPLNVTVTGTANLPITGASGGTNAGGNISLTIN